MQRAALFTSRPTNAAFYEAYEKIWFPINGTAPEPRAPLSCCSATGVENPSRLARIMRSKNSASQTATRPVPSTQLQLGPVSTLAPYVESYAHPAPHMAQPYYYSADAFLPTRIERMPVKDAYVCTTTPPPSENIGRTTELVIQSPRPTRNYNTAAFLLEGEHASQYQDPQAPPPSPFYPAWPTSSFALYIPSFGIVPSPLPSPLPQRDPMMEALLNYNALSLPAFGDNSEERTPSPVSDIDSLCPSPSSSLSSPISGGSPNSEWAKFNSPAASNTSLESNAEPSAGATGMDAVRLSALILALEEQKAEMVGEEYEVERRNILALLSEAYEKVKHLVDAGA